MNKCNWCGKGTKNEECYTSISPLIEKYEVLIREWDKMYGQFWFDSKEIDKKILADVMAYDQVSNTVGKGIICNDCHEKDEIIYQKYKQLTTKNSDPYGMLKIVVDDNDNNVDYDIDKMEIWYEDAKEKISKVGKDK